MRRCQIKSKLIAGNLTGGGNKTSLRRAAEFNATRFMTVAVTLVTLADHATKSRGDIKGRFVFFNNDAVALEQIVKVFESQQLQVVLDTIHPLEEGRAALEQVAHGHARGKVIISASR